MFIRPRAETTVPGSSDCVLTRFTHGLDSANGKPASDSLGIYFQVAKPVKTPIFIRPGDGPAGAVKLSHHFSMNSLIHAC